MGRCPASTSPWWEGERTHVYYVYALTLDPAAAGVSRRTLVRALQAEGVECYEGYCPSVVPGAALPGRLAGQVRPRVRPRACPTSERLYDETLFFHSLLYPEIEPQAESIAAAFTKVWDAREELMSLDDDGARAIRRR